MAIGKRSSDTVRSPGVDALLEGNFDNLIGGVWVGVGRVGPSDVFIPVDLARSGPIRLRFIIANATITKNEVFVGEVLGMGDGREARKGSEAGKDLETGHVQERIESV